MSRPYFNPNFPPNQMPPRQNMPPNSGSQFPFMPNNPPVNFYPQFPFSQPPMMPPHPLVQHVMVPVPVPVRPDDPTAFSNMGFFGQSVAAAYGAQNIQEPPRESKRSDDLNYYLGNETIRHSRRIRSRSRSADRYSSDGSFSGRPHSRNSDFDRRRNSSRSDREHRRHSSSPLSNKRSRSPESERLSKHSSVYRQSERSVTYEHVDRRSQHSQERHTSVHSRELRDEFENVAGKHKSRHSSYSREYNRKDDSDTAKQYYELDNEQDERKHYRREHELSEHYEDRSRAPERVDKHSYDDVCYDESRKEHWNRSKEIHHGQQRFDLERRDCSEVKRMKFDAQYERDSAIEKRNNSESYRGHYDNESRRRKSRELEHYDERAYENRDDFDRKYERHLDYDKSYNTEAGYSKDIDSHHNDYDKVVETETDYRSESHVDVSAAALKVHVSNEGRWIEEKRGDTSPVSDVEEEFQWNRENDTFEDEERDKYKINITVANDRTERRSDRRSSGEISGYRGDIDIHRDRPRLYEDGKEISDSKIRERYDRSHDKSRYNDSSVDYRESRDRRESENVDDYDRHDLSSHRYNLERVSDSGSVGNASNRGIGGQAVENEKDFISDRIGLDRNDFFPSKNAHPFSGACDLRESSHGNLNSNSRDFDTKLASRRFEQSDIDFAVPLLCADHNVKTGCQNKKCDKLHICRFYVLGRCSYGMVCKKGHDFFTGQPFTVLFQQNDKLIDFDNLNYLEQKIICKLREQMRETVRPKRAETKVEVAVPKIDPEFDAFNYVANGKFTTKSDDGGKSDEGKKSASDSMKSKEEVKSNEGSNYDGKKSNSGLKTDQKDIKSETKATDEKASSLSPVSVENVENWEKYERYERVSEDDLSNQGGELENVSSDEETSNSFPIGHHNLLAKAAIPIGMNDPLVFNPLKKGPPMAHVSSRPVGMDDLHLFNPGKKGPPQVHISGSPLFPAAKSMGMVMQNPRNLQGPMPGLMQQMNPLPHLNLQVNFLPSPDLLQQVILSLQSNQAKTEPVKQKRSKLKSSQDLDSLCEKNPELNEIIQTPWQFPHKGLLNMNVIDFVTETEAYKEEFIAELVRILITLDLPYVTMKKLMSVVKEKMLINIKSTTDLRKILEMYSDFFQIIETIESDDDDANSEDVKKNIQIKANISLGFCEKHGYLPFAMGKCNCNALHICKFFFLSICPYEHCKFGHQLKTDHNMTVLRSHKLHRMTGKEVMAYIRDVDNRHKEMIPEICRFYNKERGNCYKGDSIEAEVICHKLHLCQFYAKGKCLNVRCQRSHSVQARQPYTLLQMYGLNPDVVGEKKVLEMLAEIVLQMEQKKAARNAPYQQNKKASTSKTANEKNVEIDVKDTESTKGSDSAHSNNDSKAKKETDITCIKANLSNKVSMTTKKIIAKVPSVCRFYNNELGCKKRDWGSSGYCMFLHVCQHFVNGNCKFGDNCKRSHDLVSGQAGLLLHQQGLDTSLYTSKEIAYMISNPDTLKDLIGSSQSASETVGKIKVSDVSTVKKVVKTVETKPEVAKISSKKVEHKNIEVESKSDEYSQYKSYSVEDLLNQIIEKGKDVERKNAELSSGSADKVSEMQTESDKGLEVKEGKDNERKKIELLQSNAELPSGSAEKASEKHIESDEGLKVESKNSNTKEKTELCNKGVNKESVLKKSGVEKKK